VGANVGYYTLELARRVGRNGRVIAFEAMPKTFGRLNQNISLNPGLSVEAYNKAIGDHNGIVQFYESASTAWSSTNETRDATGETVESRVITLDEFVEEESIDHIDFIKVDIEGSEASMLRGAQQTLKRHIVKAIQVEYSASELAQQGYQADGFLRLITDHGFHSVHPRRLKKAIDSGYGNLTFLCGDAL